MAFARITPITLLNKPLSAKMLHYFAINDIHAKFSSAVV